MSGFEKEELQARMNGATAEEKQLIAETLPDTVLLGELCARFTGMRQMLDNISKTVKENSPADYQSGQD